MIEKQSTHYNFTRRKRSDIFKQRLGLSWEIENEDVTWAPFITHFALDSGGLRKSYQDTTGNTHAQVEN